MQQNTILTEYISQADKKELYDENLKKVLANKMILAWIMKECVSEYQDIDVKDIATKYIEGIPNNGKISVQTNEYIQGLPNEEVGGKNRYDIRFQAIAPDGDDFVGLIINLEAQNNFYPGYPLIKRVIYYGGSIISGQYGTVFGNSEYQKIKKVYGIWICRHAPNFRKNTITNYYMNEKAIIGNSKQKKQNYDLLSVVMICLGNPKDTMQSNVLKLLNTLLAKDVKADEKIDFLQAEFRIPATITLKKELEDMCNLSEGIEQVGIEKGVKKGVKKGIKKVVCNTVDIMRDLSVDDNIIAQKLKEKFKLSDGEIKQLLNS